MQVQGKKRKKLLSQSNDQSKGTEEIKTNMTQQFFQQNEASLTKNVRKFLAQRTRQDVAVNVKQNFTQSRNLDICHPFTDSDLTDASTTSTTHCRTSETNASKSPLAPTAEKSPLFNHILQKLQVYGNKETEVEPAAAVFMSAMMDTVLTNFLNSTVAQAKSQRGDVSKSNPKILINPRHIQDAVQYSSNLRELVLGKVTQSSKDKMYAANPPSNETIANATHEVIPTPLTNITSHNTKVTGDKKPSSLLPQDSKSTQVYFNERESSTSEMNRTSSIPVNFWNLKSSETNNSDEATNLLQGQILLVETMNTSKVNFNDIASNGGGCLNIYHHQIDVDHALENCAKSMSLPGLMCAMYFEVISRSLTLLHAFMGHYNVMQQSYTDDGITVITNGFLHPLAAAVTTLNKCTTRKYLETIEQYFYRQWFQRFHICRPFSMNTSKNVNFSKAMRKDQNSKRIRIEDYTMARKNETSTSSQNNNVNTVAESAPALGSLPYQQERISQAMCVKNNSTSTGQMSTQHSLSVQMQLKLLGQHSTFLKSLQTQQQSVKKRKRGRPSKQDIFKRQQAAAAASVVTTLRQRQWQIQQQQLLQQQRQLVKQQQIQQQLLKMMKNAKNPQSLDRRTLSKSKSNKLNCICVCLYSDHHVVRGAESVLSSNSDLPHDTLFEIVVRHVSFNTPFGKSPVTNLSEISNACISTIVVNELRLKHSEELLQLVASNFYTQIRQLATCSSKILYSDIERDAYIRQIHKEIRFTFPPGVESIRAKEASNNLPVPRTIIYASEENLLVAHTLLLAGRHMWPIRNGPGLSDDPSNGQECVVYVCAQLWDNDEDNDDSQQRPHRKHNATSQAQKKLRCRCALKRLILCHFEHGHHVIFFGSAKSALLQTLLRYKPQFQNNDNQIPPNNQ